MTMIFIVLADNWGLLLIFSFELGYYAGKFHDVDTDDDHSYDNSGKILIDHDSKDGTSEHQRDGDWGVAVVDGWLAIQRPSHLVDHVAERCSEDAGKDHDSCVFGRHGKEKDEYDNIGSSAA